MRVSRVVLVQHAFETWCAHVEYRTRAAHPHANVSVPGVVFQPLRRKHAFQASVTRHSEAAARAAVDALLAQMACAHPFDTVVLDCRPRVVCHTDGSCFARVSYKQPDGECEVITVVADSVPALLSLVRLQTQELERDGFLVECAQGSVV